MNRGFQYNMATGRATLPAAVIVSLVLWIIQMGDYYKLTGLIICGLSTYLIIWLNSTFAIIRTRSYLAPSFFSLIYTASSFTFDYHDFRSIIPLLFIGSMFSMIKGYESRNPPFDVFNAFLFAGLGCMVNNNLIVAIPILFVCMIQLRSINVRGILAAILGFATPLWIMTGYYAYTDNMDKLMELATEFFRITPFGYGSIKSMHWICMAVTTIIFISCAIPAIRISLKDKVKNRSIIKALNTVGSYLVVVMTLIPSTGISLIPVLMLITSILIGYVMTQLYNRATLIILISSLVMVAVMAVSELVL